VKSLFSVILIASLLSFQFSELLVYVVFKVNQEHIAKNLCIEKDIEGSTCKGCCHLKKKMNEQKEQKKELPPVQNNKQNIDFCTHYQEIKLLIYFTGFELPLNPPKIYQFEIIDSVFHPPKEMI